MFIFEIIKYGLIGRWRYKTDFIVGYVMSIILGFGLAYGFSSLGGQANSFLIGYIFFMMYQAVSTNMGRNVESQARSGTLERMITLPISHIKILFANNLTTLLHTSISLTLLFSLSLILGFNFSFNFLITIPILIISLIFFFSISYIFAGLALVTKRIGTVNNFLNMMFFTISVYAVGNYHSSLYHLFRWFPYTQALILLKKIEVDGAPFSEILPGLLPLTISSIIFLIISLGVFKWCDRYTRIKGLLGQY